MFYSEQPHVSLERLAKLVLSIPKGVVEHQTAVQFVPSRLYGVIAWPGIFGVWKGDCLGSSL